MNSNVSSRLLRQLENVNKELLEKYKSLVDGGNVQDEVYSLQGQISASLSIISEQIKEFERSQVLKEMNMNRRQLLKDDLHSLKAIFESSKKEFDQTREKIKSVKIILLCINLLEKAR